MNELLGYFSREARLAILLAVIGPLVYWFLRRKKSADNSSKIETGDITAGGDVQIAGGDIINIYIAGVEELRKRVERLEQEQGKSLPKEKIDSCFVPGIKELEAGRKLLQYGKKTKAKYHLEEAIKFFICATDALLCYETYFNLASAYDDYCDYENAKENYQKAIQHDPTQPGAYNGLGVVYGKTSDYPKAEKYFQQVLATAEKLTNPQERLGWQANALTNLGNVYRNTGQMEQALKHHQQALNIHQEIGDKLGEANALSNQGSVYAQTGQTEYALKHYQQALNIFREIGDKLGQSTALMGLGIVYRKTNQTQEALKYHQQALKIDREIGNKLGEAHNFSNLGILYRETNQIKLALERYQQGLKIHREIGNKLGQAQDLNNLGTIYHQTGQMEQAREHFLLARAIFQQIGAPHLVKQVDENLAKLPGR